MAGYSTLEVNPNQDSSNVASTNVQAQPDYSQFPEAVPPQWQTDGLPKYHSTHKVYIPNDHLAPEAVPNQQHYSAEQGNEALWQPKDAHLTGKAPTQRTTICGLQRRTFFIVLGISLLVVGGAIAGGIAGAIVSRRSATDNRVVTLPNRANVMDISSLAASNWTDGKGHNHRIVFFQDPWNSIVARRWDSQNNTWSTSNITAVTLNTATPLTPAPGTTLASAALDWPNAYRIQLYFLDPSDIIRSTFSDAPVQLPDLWKNDTLGTSNIHVMHGSKLAAAWARDADPKQIGVWTLAWQGADRGFVKVSNFSDYNAAVNGVEANRVARNTTLALVPQYGGVQASLGLVSQSFTSSTGGSMQVSSWNETWKKTPNEIIPNIPLPAQNQHTAVAKWGNWTKTICYTLLDDGSMKGSWWQDVTDQNALSNINLSGGPTVNFTAITMTLDAMFYGISEDEIHEYAVDASDPARLNYVGKIYP